MPAIDLYDLTRPRFDELTREWGFKPAHAARLWKRLYRDAATDLNSPLDLPPRLRDELLSQARLAPLPAASELQAADGLARKCLLRLHDGRAIETVVMRYPGRATACVSSQAGCALGCAFCATGQAGFARNLSTGEIVAQTMHAVRSLHETQARLRNVVVMGMGEPLLNYDSVVDALEILRHPAGLAIGAKRITVSTAGVVPGIVRWTDERLPYSLAVSLHAANQDDRASIMPLAKTWPLDDLMAACRRYAAILERRVFFEWTLIAGVNDTPHHAAELAQLLDGIPAQVNIIPLNATEGFSGTGVDIASLSTFRESLQSRGLPVSIRQRRGIEIAAGCGQLAGMA